MSILGNFFGSPASKLRELHVRILELEATIQTNAGEIADLKATNEKNAVEIEARGTRIVELRADVESREREITRLLNEAQRHRR